MRDSRIDSVRLFCNLLIVIAHVYPFMYLSRGADFWLCYFICRSMALMAIPALFVLSGYLLFKNYDAVGYKGKILSRILRLGVPLLVWDVIYIVLYNLIGLVSPSADNTVMRLGINTFGGILNQFSPSCNLAIGPFWYVRAVLILGLAAPLYLWVYEHIHWSILLAVCIPLTFKFDNVISSHYPMYGISLFLLGGLLSYKGIDMVEWFTARRKFLIPVGAIVICLGFMRNVWTNDISESCGIVKFASVFAIWCCADYIHMSLNKSWIRSYIMPVGFMIYAAHTFFAQTIVHSVGKFVCELPIKFAPLGLLSMALCFLLTVSICVTLWHMTRKLCPQVLAILDGKMSLSGYK